MIPTPAAPPAWLAAAFPVFFLSLWLIVTSLLGLLSGWFALQRRFPRNEDSASLRIGRQSGTMRGVNFSGILSLEACPSGLRVGVWRIFGPFQRPFQVPWDQIEAEPVTRFLMPMMRLRFGRPAARAMTINQRAWDRLKAAAQGMAPPNDGVTTKRLVRASLVQWAAITIFAGGFFYLMPRLFGPNPQQAVEQVPLVVCFAFPGAVFGIVGFVRFLYASR